jgi:hypothetical protein
MINGFISDEIIEAANLETWAGRMLFFQERVEFFKKYDAVPMADEAQIHFNASRINFEKHWNRAPEALAAMRANCDSREAGSTPDGRSQ